MMPPEVRTLLYRFRDALAHVQLPGDLDGQAVDLLDHLLELHDGGRLNPPFLKLAMESFEDIPQVEQFVRPLARFAEHHSIAMGHREAQRSDALPWITSSYAGLEPKGVLEGMATSDAPEYT